MNTFHLLRATVAALALGAAPAFAAPSAGPATVTQAAPTPGAVQHATAHHGMAQRAGVRGELAAARTELREGRAQAAGINLDRAETALLNANSAKPGTAPIQHALADVENARAALGHDNARSGQLVGQALHALGKTPGI